MGKILWRLKISRRNKIVMEAALAVLFIIVFISVLGGITATCRTTILSTEDIWKHANTTLITFEFRNTTDPAQGTTKTYRLADIASFYDGYLYISIPYPSGYEILRAFSIYNFTANDGQAITAGYLIEHGVNRLELYIEPINSTAVTFGSGWYVSPLEFVVDSSGDWPWACNDVVLATIVSDTADAGDGDDVKWKALFPDNGTVNRIVNIDLGTVAIKVAGYGDRLVGIARFVGDAQNLEGLKLKLEIYAVSEKPVLKALTEPIYSVLAGLYAAFLAAVNRIRQYAASAFAGFSTSFAFTGLIGDPVVALIVTLVIITVFFVLMKRK